MKANADTFINAEQIVWNLDEKGVLLLEGQGKIPDYDCGPNPAAPWKDVKNQIVEVFIQEGITEIGMNAFRDCENLKKAVFPDTLERIQSYAFWNCKQLVCIESKRTDFKYVYDERAHKYIIDNQANKKSDTIVFGIDSFRNVPWSKDKWGNFYCQEDKLYVTFEGESRELVVPEGVRVIKAFSMKSLDVDSVILPDTLEVIEDFAFSDSIVKEDMILPDSIEMIEPHAFADCFISLISFPTAWRPEKIRWERTGSAMVRRKIVKVKKVPEYINKFSIALQRRKCYGKFRKMQIRENKEIHHKDGTVTKVRDNNRIDVGSSMYRRIRSGKILLCVTYQNNRVISVTSFAWDREDELTNEYLMYPVKDEGEELLPWRDSFTYQEKEAIVYAFFEKDGTELKNAGELRFSYPYDHEEWFWSNDRDNFGGPLEMEFLNMWLSMHPEMTVDTTDDNIKKDNGRLFVRV